MKNTALTLVFIFFFLGICSQNESKIWHFGMFGGLDFATNPPSAVTGTMWTNAGCSSISDASGALLFYSNGKKVFNKNHVTMANGTGLLGNESSTQTGLIVKQPGTQNSYFVFSLDGGGGPDGLHYSMVDMSLAAGLGSVTIQNIPLYSPSTEKIAATTHCNGTDIWVVSHEYGTNVFRSYLVTASGISSAAVTSPVGPIVNSQQNAQGQMKFSPNGTKLGVASYMGDFQVYDFDRATGQVSNPFTLASDVFFYGCEFSPDGKKIYGSRFSPGGGAFGAQLIQWDLCAGSQNAVLASQYSVTMSSTTTPPCAALQLATDGKIYIATIGQFSLSVINNPNAAGAACGYSALSQTLQSSNSVLWGLPSFVNYPASTPPVGSITWTANCQKVAFTPPPGVNISGACGSSLQPVSGVEWLFGDTGAQSTASSTVPNPEYAYSGSGTYQAMLVIHYPCKSDTISAPVTITQTVPLIGVSGNTLLCLGETAVLTATGASTYSWNGTAGATTATFSPPASTSYTVSGSSGSTACPVTSQVVSVTVLPCTDIGEKTQSNLRVYPNPLSNVLTVETEATATLELYDVSGRLHQREFVTQGVHNISVGSLSEGIYLLRIRTSFETKMMRLYKCGMD
jgi:hypothetical protein